jgi:hypothetical protein
LAIFRKRRSNSCGISAFEIIDLTPACFPHSTSRKALSQGSCGYGVLGYVDHVEAHCARARAAGATMLLVEHPDFGLTLNPFDLATNKLLVLVGRLEVRD